MIKAYKRPFKRYAPQIERYTSGLTAEFLSNDLRTEEL
jgi:hypothetical protein